MTNRENNDASQRLPKLLLSGLDSLYVAYALDGLGFDWEELQYQKERLKQDRRRGFAPITLGGRSWALSPGGSYPYRFVLSDAHLRVCLAEAMQPNCYVQFLSNGLWTKGHQTLHAEILEWFATLGTKQVRPEAVSRADFAFDFDLPIVDFTQDNLVSRATKDTQWRQHGAIQTIQVGSGAMVMRLYDKVAEIEQASDKYWFFDLWGQKEKVWRVEFQVRKERLKLAGISNLDSLDLLAGDLLRELALHHSSLRRISADRNRSRWPLHPLWIALREAIDAAPQTGLIEAYNPGNALSYLLRRQIQSLYGDLKGLGALVSFLGEGQEAVSLEDLVRRLPRLLRGFHQEDLWRSELEKRMEARRLGQ